MKRPLFRSNRFNALALLAVLQLLSMALFGASAHAQFEKQLTDLLDRAVYDVDDREIGDIEDVVLRRTGQVQSVLIARHGFLGLGSKLIALPIRKLEPRKASGYRIAHKRDELKNLPEFDYNQPNLYKGSSLYPPPAQGQPRQNGGNPYRMHHRRNDSTGGPYENRPRSRAEPYFTYPWLQTYFPSKLLGTGLLGQVVRGRKARRIAEIQDLLISQKNGRTQITRILVTRDNLLDLDPDPQSVSLPYRPLRINKFGVYYPITENKLERLLENDQRGSDG